jgi:acyl-CoA synthetase (AMP-forming)/AMP-acid ligase II
MSFNLAVILSETAHAAPDRPVAVFDGGRLTYRELDQASDRLAAGLAAAGIEPGDRVAPQLPNIPQFLISYFGILKAGAVVVPLNVLLRAPEVAFHLSDSGARALITWEGVVGEAAKGAEAASVGDVYAVGHAGDAAGAWPFERLLDGIALPREVVMRQPTDTAVIVYTSGTIGRPKGAELTHLQLYMNADIPGRLFDVQPDDIVVAVLPLFHVFGLSSIMDCCVRFGCIVSRRKDLIIRGGYNVYPSEIENVLHAHPAVAEAAVVGIPDERLGEEVMAVIIRRPSMDLPEHELVSYCRERMAAYKCPRVFQFRSELPKNALGKVLKDELAAARPGPAIGG